MILRRPYLDKILAGRKSIESRFTVTRRAPYGCVAARDKIFLKLSSGPVCASAFVKRVLEFENLSPGKIKRIKSKYNNLILGGEDYWADKRESKYGVLVWLEGVERIEPVLIEKKDWRAWVVLEKGKDFGLL